MQANDFPEKVTMDKSGVNKAAIDEINASSETPIIARQVKYLNNSWSKLIAPSNEPPNRSRRLVGFWWRRPYAHEQFRNDIAKPPVGDIVVIALVPELLDFKARRINR